MSNESVFDYTAPLECQYEEALQRILDAAINAGGVLAGNRPTRKLLWSELSLICMYWLPGAMALDDRTAARHANRRHKRITKAASVLQRELSGYTDYRRHGNLANEIDLLLRYLTPSPADADDYDFTEFCGPGSVLLRLVGNLSATFARTFDGSSGYTTDPDSGETDGPFIRFAEQTLREFRITRDGNQPYQRRSLADALNKYKKIKAGQAKTKNFRP